MFGYIRRNRAKVVVESTLPTLREGIQALSPVDRAATLAIVNAMLEVASDQWGEAALRNPGKLDPGAAASAVLNLAAHHARLVREGLGQMEDRGMDDVAYAQAMRETRATELIIVSLGSRFVEGGKEDLTAAWRMLWGARSCAAEAAEVLREYARHARVEALPRSRRRLQGTPPAEIARLAGVLPPFLRPRASKPGSGKPGTGKPAASAAGTGRVPGAGPGKPSGPPPSATPRRPAAAAGRPAPRAGTAGQPARGEGGR